ncbi:nose resistant to fluoxetine protein 6-like [Zerene cesonia]|uniref:nose resistant to fluoxetine protein 6-like n=1 Tax=Zerene cesonia TaxID=33412 RepID=UPI0018E52D37|nr:nose resistant to fluoxetine protein 6-like [Zerene cesonia]
MVLIGLFLFILCGGVFTNASTKCLNKPATVIDILIRNILDEVWEEHERLCLKETLNILRSAQNSTLWASWVMDSMQTPSGLFYGNRYNLGNYDECIKPYWLKTHPDLLTQYCTAEVYLSEKKFTGVVKDPYSTVEQYIHSESRYGLRFNCFTWGVCVPRSCERHSVNKIVMALYKLTHLVNSIQDPRIQVDSCQSSISAKTSFGYHVFMSILLVAVVSVFVGSLYVTCGEVNDNTLGRIAKSLSLTINASSLVHQSADDVTTLHGVRALLSLVVVALHVSFVTTWIGAGNAVDLDRDTEEKGIINLYQGESVVDSFLVMSAILLIKNFMMTGRIHLFRSILKRYLRFVLFIGPIILYFLFVIVHTGSGPLWSRLSEREMDACGRSWWISLLMLGNYVDTTNICYPILWTVPADFQLTVVAMILLWIYQKNTRIAVIIYSLLTIASLILPGLYVYQHQSSPVPPLHLGGLANYRETLFASPIYLWTHLRAGPYFLGLAMGYLMSVYKPSNYRNVISYKWSLISLIILYIITSFIMVCGGHFHNTSRVYGLWLSVLFASLNRPLWAVVFCGFLCICEYGTASGLQRFLRWRPFTVLSKLSYGLYLVHTILISRWAAALRSPLRYDMFETMLITSGVITMSFFISFALYLIIEAPLGNVVNMIFQKERDNRALTENGANISKKKVA